MALNDEEAEAEPSSACMHIEDLLLAVDVQEVELVSTWGGLIDLEVALALVNMSQAGISDSIADIDTDLFLIFQEEANELLPELGISLR